MNQLKTNYHFHSCIMEKKHMDYLIENIDFHYNDIDELHFFYIINMFSNNSMNDKDNQYNLKLYNYMQNQNIPLLLNLETSNFPYFINNYTVLNSSDKNEYSSELLNKVLNSKYQ